MKKTLFVFLFLFLATLVLSFILIPAQITVTNSRILEANRNGFISCLHNLKKWQKWWPVDSNKKITYGTEDSIFNFQNIQYRFTKAVTDGAEIKISVNKLELPSKILVLPKTGDSLLVQWSIFFQKENNPILRIKNYFIATQLKDKVQSILDSLCMFAGKVENVYNFPIRRTTFQDTILITHKLITPEPPDVKQVYYSIREIRQYIISQGAFEKDYPMLNTKRLDNKQYETMIAVCINKKVNDNKEYAIVRMVNMKDKFLTTEVTGGPSTIEDAHAAILKYMDDRKLSAPGRPFEIMVTDRSIEPDTSKWKTIIYHPSM